MTEARALPCLEPATAAAGSRNRSARRFFTGGTCPCLRPGQTPVETGNP